MVLLQAAVGITRIIKRSTTDNGPGLPPPPKYPKEELPVAAIKRLATLNGPFATAVAVSLE